MGFKRVPQKFSASIKEVTIGTGEKAIKLGGENVMPLYTFDAEIANAPKVGVESATQVMIKPFPDLQSTMQVPRQLLTSQRRQRQCPALTLLFSHLRAPDPNGENKSIDECVAIAKEVADAITAPLAIEGCKNAEKDAELFSKIADALQGKNVLFISAKEENYKTIAASAGLAYGQKISAESAVDINLAKQLNVLISQMGLQPDTYVMNVGAATAGYGFEYVVSTMDRVKSAAQDRTTTCSRCPL